MLEYAGSQRTGSRAQQGERTELRALLRRVDWVLLGAVAGVVAVGLWAVAGITRHDIPGDPHYYLYRQAVYAAVGGIGLVIATLIDPDLYRRNWRVLFGGTCLVIALVFLAGPIRGSKRWIDLGFIQFQPSEFGKLLIVLSLAGFLAERGRRLNTLDTMLRAVALGLIPIALVFLQPDIGTALVYTAALAAILFTSGIRWLHLAVLGTVALVAVLGVLWFLPAAGFHILKPYQQSRLTCFTTPSKCEEADGYNLDQSIVAVASGQVRGRGIQGATQTRLAFLPEHRTDFVFASYSEQRGFVGAILLLGLYLLVVWRGLRTITVARDLYSAIVAGGIAFALLFQIFVNVGMTMGIAPITGIPLPFVSVGGSSMIANLTAMGVLLAIHARAKAGRGRRRA
jgi:rod shape determining protein RodA